MVGEGYSRCVTTASLMRLPLCSSGQPQPHRRPRTSSARPPPAGARLVLETAAQGVQIYTCEKAGDLYRWAFTAPDAALFDQSGRQIGTHFAGPSWQLLDTSKIIGEVVAQAPAPEPHAIAWLLLGAAK